MNRLAALRHMRRRWGMRARPRGDRRHTQDSIAPPVTFIKIGLADPLCIKAELPQGPHQRNRRKRHEPRCAVRRRHIDQSTHDQRKALAAVDLGIDVI